MHPIAESRQCLARRELFGRTSTGVGMAALASLLGAESARGAGTSLDSGQGGTGIPGLPHLAPRAKRVICLFQNGAPTHVDLFDWKPRLRELHGQPLPAGYADGKRFSTMTGQADGKLMLAPVEPFRQRGESGAWVSDFLPWTAGIADRLCFVHSMHTEAVNHAPAIQFLLSGSQLPGRPTMGAWLTYGLGSETESLPGFVVMTSITKNTSCGQIFYDFYWGSGFLSSRFQGVKFRAAGDPVLYISNPPGISRQMRREWLDDIARVNELSQQQYGDPEIASRIAQYEMAFRMQTSAPELTDLSRESAATLQAYGPEVRKPGSYAANCLLARRLAERNVRFIQLFHMGWDHHGGLPKAIRGQCKDTDQATAALVLDLKQRGLLEDTLIVWGGEFGRTIYSQGGLTADNYGRDHHPRCFTMWLAGAGVKAGLTYGETDDYCYNIVRDPVSIYDLHATMLHTLGLDHTKLTFRYAGRDFRLTDIYGEVVRGILS